MPPPAPDDPSFRKTFIVVARKESAAAKLAGEAMWPGLNARDATQADAASGSETGVGEKKNKKGFKAWTSSSSSDEELERFGEI